MTIWYLAKMNMKSCFIFLISGGLGGGGRDTQCRSYNPSTQIWTTNPNPPFTSNQYEEACTLFYSPKHSNRPVVMVVGGKDIKTEILDYTVPDAQWEMCKYLQE